MIKSKLTLWNILIPVLLIAIPILPFLFFLNNENEFALENFKIRFIPIVILLFISFLLMIGTIKRRILILKLTDQKIFVKTFITEEKEYNYNEFDGFETTLEHSRSGTYEALYLIKDKKSIIHISRFHIKNYFELKKMIETKLPNLGFVKTNIFNSWKRFL